MPRNKTTKPSPIPQHFKSVAAAAAFWDRNDLTDYLGKTREVKGRVDVRRRTFLTALEPGLAKKVEAYAKRQGVSSQTLINLWLAEKVQSLLAS